MVRVYGGAEVGYVREVLESGQLTWRPGGFVSRFEAAFAQLVGSRFAVARNSATVSIVQALGLCAPDSECEVICDPLVDFGVVAAQYFGAVPRFADVRYGTFLMDPESVRALITPRTRALIVVHLWGLCAELDELRRICDAHGIFMIEDTAHVVDAYWQGKHAGTFGDVAVWAFQQTKQIGLSDAGLISTDQEELYTRLYSERAYGMNAPPFTLDLRLHELAGAVGLGQVQRAKDYAAYYTQSLDVLNAAIAGCAWLKQREVPAAAKQAGYWWACIWEGDKHGLDYDRFKQICGELGLPVQFGFNQTPAYNQDAFRSLSLHHRRERTRLPSAGVGSAGLPAAHCPVAEDLMPRLITSDLIEVPHAEIARRAAQLEEAVRRMER